MMSATVMKSRYRRLRAASAINHLRLPGQPQLRQFARGLRRTRYRGRRRLRYGRTRRHCRTTAQSLKTGTRIVN